jgi:hypothetical protein
MTTGDGHKREDTRGQGPDVSVSGSGAQEAGGEEAIRAGCQAHLLALLREKGPRTLGELSDCTDLPIPDVENFLAAPVAQGRVDVHGSGSDKLYRLNRKERMAAIAAAGVAVSGS